MPITTRSQAKQLEDRRSESPAWDCETQSLPENDPDGPPCASPVDATSAESPAINSHTQNAKSPKWLPWQDRFLAREVFAHRPFLAGQHKISAAWDTLAAKMKEDSGDEIERTGSACRTRFKLLIKHQKKNETRSLQKTGTNEEIDDHIKVMIDLVDLVEGYEASKEEFTASTKKQQEMQQKAALQMRASVREKQGQRKRKLMALSESDKENVNSHSRKRVRHQTAIDKAL
ncbi:hypothetical protein M422DRAFT_256740 [Sphaerobolus stellatus SS14]|uniref:Myb-like domain-containing protein n=1 Tax=Sphaerobolus stellatus (strain SS14) TaxID=990650 RepID=A0A0C9V065_SPHS4|nr:hypothetical protein M422DRAFT_256740 [Sphaerobolus stellatus SS14]